MKARLQKFTMALLGLAVLRLYHQGKLTLYIHPSTIWLVLLAGAVLLSIYIGMLAKRHSHSHATGFQLGAVFLVAIILAAGKNVPPSSVLVKQRESGALPVASRSGLNLNGLTQNFNVLEWLAAWDSDPSHQRYLGSPVSVTGFITRDGGQYYISRLLITCCVVDAQPVELPLAPDGRIPAEGTWVEVKGVMGEKDQKPLVKAASLERIPVPEQQYVY